jgi:hypothetical protein
MAVDLDSRGHGWNLTLCPVGAVQFRGTRNLHSDLKCRRGANNALDLRAIARPLAR